MYYLLAKHKKLFTLAILVYMLTSSLPLFAFAEVDNSTTPKKSDPIEFTHFSLFLNEDPNWKIPDYENSNWHHFDLELRKRSFDDIYWVSWSSNVEQRQVPSRDLEFFVSALGAFEFYVDEILVYRNGFISSEKQQEIPGDIQISFLVPKELLSVGLHKMAFKISSHHRVVGQRVIREANLIRYNPSYKHTSLRTLIPSLALSIALIIGLYFSILYFSDRENAWLILFSLLCFDLFIYGLAIEWKYLVGYTYDWDYTAQITAAISGTLFAILLPLSFLKKHGLSKWWFLLFLMPVVGFFTQLIIGTELKMGYVWSIGLFFSLIISVIVTWKNGGQYWWEMLGVLICFLGMLYSLDDAENFFLIFPILIFFVLLTNVIQTQRDKHNGLVVKIKASQLEAQLLRRNIQPHFILNSLASIVELVETAPDKSIEFISALADEFRLFSEIANCPYVSISQEISLCENHLSIMGYRYQQNYTLEVTGLTKGILIPTGIIHTIMENAFTHNDYSTSNYSFELSIAENDKDQLITLKAPKTPIAKTRFGRLNTGTGSNFIESQLKQSCGKNWRYESSPTPDGWISEITYRKIKNDK